MITDFVRRITRPESPDWIIRSLLDVDFYKFTMGYFIYRLHRGVQVQFSFINRNLKIPFATIIDEQELRAQLDHVRTLRLRHTDLVYLRGQDVYGHNMFSEEYLQFLSTLQLPSYTLTRVDDQYELSFKGTWEVVTFWETIALAVISELFYRSLMRSMTELELRVLYARATDKLYAKLTRLQAHPRIRFADFGQRRRHSFLWQQFAINMSRDILGARFTGTSDTWMAFNQDLTPIGTNAHELPMVLTALADGNEAKQQAQYTVLTEWGPMFTQGGLRIMLPDTYGSLQFFQNMPKELAQEVAHNWRGMRQDSGDPIAEGKFFMDWLTRQGADPSKKLFIPSDGLDVDPMITIDDALGNGVELSNGLGTMLTNDFIGCHPRGNEQAVVRGQPLNFTWDEIFRGHSIVCKVQTANGKPAVKLSNNVNKATGPKSEVLEYLKIFGQSGRTSQEVFV